MARSTTYGYWRQRGGKGTPAPYPAVLAFSFDPTVAAGTATGKVLPKGARVLEVLLNGAATGGVSPTVDIGYVGGAADALVNEGDADGGASRTLVVGAPLAAATEVAAGVGASAATGGTVTAAIVYVMDDDGTE